MARRICVWLALLLTAQSCSEPTPPEDDVPPPPGQFVMVSAGRGHVCALDTIGRGWCWGNNDNGQSAGDLIIVSPAPIPTALRFTAISAGDGHTCAITGEGVAYCWGSNEGGQLGVPTVPPERSCRTLVTTQLVTTCTSKPQAVSGGFRFKSIMAGPYSTCGLTVGGVLKCWGLVDLRNDTTVVGMPTTPFPFGDDSLWSSVSRPRPNGGGCGITSKGAPACWGYNGEGNLGIGTYGTDSPVPVTPKLDAAIKSISDNGSCAIVVSGDAYCWGPSIGNLLGVGIANSVLCHGGFDFVCFPTPQLVVGGHKFTQITGSRSHSCGIEVSGETFCWGLNENYELGTTAIDFTLSSGAMAGITGSGKPVLAANGAKYVSVTAGSSFTCGLAPDRNVYCWGVVPYGALGIPYENGVYRRADPVRIVGDGK